MKLSHYNKPFSVSHLRIELINLEAESKMNRCNAEIHQISFDTFNLDLSK